MVCSFRKGVAWESVGVGEEGRGKDTLTWVRNWVGGGKVGTGWFEREERLGGMKDWRMKGWARREERWGRKDWGMKGWAGGRKGKGSGRRSAIGGMRGKAVGKDWRKG
jgi:hypothetical protein